MRYALSTLERILAEHGEDGAKKVPCPLKIRVVTGFSVPEHDGCCSFFFGCFRLEIRPTQKRSQEFFWFICPWLFNWMGKFYIIFYKKMGQFKPTSLE